MSMMIEEEQEEEEEEEEEEDTRTHTLKCTRTRTYTGACTASYLQVCGLASLFFWDGLLMEIREAKLKGEGESGSS